MLVCVERHSLVGRNHVFTHRYITSRPGQQQVLQISYQAMRTSILVPEKNRSEQKNSNYIKKTTKSKIKSSAKWGLLNIKVRLVLTVLPENIKSKVFCLESNTRWR